jgi:hypothetical protein
LVEHQALLLDAIGFSQGLASGAFRPFFSKIRSSLKGSFLFSTTVEVIVITIAIGTWFIAPLAVFDALPLTQWHRTSLLSYAFSLGIGIAIGRYIVLRGMK